MTSIKMSFLHSTMIMLAILNVWSFARSQDLDSLQSCLTAGGLTNVTTHADFNRYDYILKYSLQNLRYTEQWVPKPALIILPMKKEEVQAAVKCCVETGWMMCIRSGGHDFEGLSSWADVPFVIVDLMNLVSITVDIDTETAWAEAGATVGQLYAAIGNATDEFAFAAGDCPTVGLGGHISGGGLGTYHRAFGLASDSVEDVIMVDAKGDFLDKTNMTEDVYWALRGGGGGSWGVVVAWKLKLARVPKTIAHCQVTLYGETNVTESVYNWQTVATEAEDKLSIYLGVSANSSTDFVAADYNVVYLGDLEELFVKMEALMPELSLSTDVCWNETWLSTETYGDLTDRAYNKSFFKQKGDFTTKPIPKSALKGLWNLLGDNGASLAFSPLGGMMSKIAADASPFPYRKGYMLNIMYGRYWTTPANDQEYLEYLKEIYEYMTPFVAENPRAAYVNCIDLDLGYARNGTATVQEARKWGAKYFQGNYERLVKAKTQIDPTNVFRNAQSIPPATSSAQLSAFQ